MRLIIFATAALALAGSHATVAAQDDNPELFHWNALAAELPDELGVAGPFAGVHNDALIVAGGANFPQPVWENQKVWRDRIYVLWSHPAQPLHWTDAGRLPRPLAYGASVTIDDGVLCLGGNDENQAWADVFLLQWDKKSGTVRTRTYPSLPHPIAFSGAAVVDDTVYVVAGQSGQSLDSATKEVWAYDLTAGDQGRWRAVKPLPGPTRALHLVASQHNGFENALYVMSGRRQAGDEVEFLRDVWEYTPATDSWRRRADMPQPMMAGTAIDIGQSHILVPGGADGSLFTRAAELKDQHPGFPRRSFLYHTITDRWISAGETPANHVTTTAVHWGNSIIIPSGEIRPRVRSPKIWRVTPIHREAQFGLLNYSVLFAYLLAMVGIGIWFARSNTTTDMYFRGGKTIPWWAAGCSIFATMLSSLTYTGVPSKAFAQDWVYAVGNAMIPVVAIVAVLVALPFFRRIDATSAYEYLEKRFNRRVRLFASASFTVFHIFRMAVVMSLTGLALAVATPLSAADSVRLMGLLSIVYCTLGGIEAVIWTDTIQTVVLLGGAILAFLLLISGVDGGFSEFITTAQASDKFNLANLHWDPTNARLALWVVIAGGIAQNLSSYTADQAVVQRYMTTPSTRLAARSIWTNAVLAIPATLLFFGIGTALFVFYRAHPEKLEPGLTTDQIFPMFIAREMPAGLAGLMVAGIFAAAQSTVSTSMNSTATTIVTDFLRPFNLLRSERAYLRAAQGLTLSLGIAGTLLALVFVDPRIRSLFDEFIKVIGLFMGVLGGLFILGATTTRSNGTGALTGALVGAATMFCLWRFSSVQGYLYTAAGVSTCIVVGYLASLWAGSNKPLTGLTIHTLHQPGSETDDSETSARDSHPH